jgi:hypothetical protein
VGDACLGGGGLRWRRPSRGCIDDLESTTDDAAAQAEDLRSDLDSLCYAIRSAYNFAEFGTPVEDALSTITFAC